MLRTTSKVILALALLPACQSAPSADAPASSPSALTAPEPPPATTPVADESELRNIAKEAYAFGVPMVEMYKTMYAFSIDTTNPQYRGPFNSVLNIARVFTPKDTAFVTPNSDTPYTFAGLDLRAEPVVLTVPKIAKDRYFVFQLMDFYTFNFDYIGSRATGNDGGKFLIAPVGWKGEVPPGITKVIHAETQFVMVVGRTQLFNAGDLDKVKAIQKEYKLQTLSAFLSQNPPLSPAPVDWIPPLPAGQELSLEFFHQLAFLLQFAEPPHASEVALRQRFQKIGIEPGKPFNAAALSEQQRSALLAGMREGQQEIDARRKSLAGKTDMLFGDREFLKNDYVARATGTQVGIGANSREEAIYPIHEKDAAGQTLDGTQHKYTLRFAKDELPPVNAFWSITMYNLPQQLLVENPLNRYLINSPMLPSLKRDADGGLTIYIQSESPGKAKESNWLPAPAGPFMLALRYYWPKEAILKGEWTTPQVQMVE